MDEPPADLRRVDAELFLEGRAVARRPRELDDEPLARLDHADHPSHRHGVPPNRLHTKAQPIRPGREVCSPMPSFRKDYLTYDELTAVLKGWEKDHPDVCSLRSIGRSEQGREQWLLVIGPDPDVVRPTVWVDGNMHAVELAGSSVALAIAEDAIRIFEGETVHDLPAPVLDAIRAVRFFVLPRMSPDGAEAIL